MGEIKDPGHSVRVAVWLSLWFYRRSLKEKRS